MKLLFNFMDYLLSLVHTNNEANDEVLKRCETEGFNASSSGMSHTSNPYKPDTPEHKAWSAGFWVW